MNLEENIDDCKKYISTRLNEMSEKAYPVFLTGYSLYKRNNPTPACELDVINKAFEDVVEMEKVGYVSIPKWANYVY